MSSLPEDLPARWSLIQRPGSTLIPDPWASSSLRRLRVAPSDTFRPSHHVLVEHRPRQFTDKEVGAMPEALGLTIPCPVVVVIGGAGNLDAAPQGSNTGVDLQSIRSAIERTMSEALGPALAKTRAVVLTGGTDAGVMRIAGKTLAGVAPALIGVAPASKTTGDQAEAELEPNHTAVVLTSGERWGSETEVLFELAERLSGGVAPGIVILANGGPVSFEEARRFLRGGWPILAVANTLGSAADLVDAVRHPGRESGWGDLKDADVETLASDSATARRQLLWRLHGDELLKSAWATFASYDKKAADLKSGARRSRVLLTVMSSVFLVAVTGTVQFALVGWVAADGAVAAGMEEGWLRSALPIALAITKWTVLALPVGIAVAAALGSFSGAQGKWRAVRASAETLKREIYRYRAPASPDKAATVGRLAAVLHVVDDEAIRAEVGLADNPPGVTRGRPDNLDLDELETLTAKIYIKRRLEQQMIWFRAAARRRRRSDWFVVLAGAGAASVAMLLVNTPLAPWVALLVLAATAFTVSRERGLTRQQVVGFDRAIADVNDGWVRWLQRAPADRMQPADLARLVNTTESAFERESLSWSEVMRRAAQDKGPLPYLGS